MRKLFIKYYSLYILILLVTCVISIISATIFNVQDKFPEYSVEELEPVVAYFSQRMGAIFFLVGTIFVFISTKYVLKPILNLSDCATKVSKGDFTVRAEFFQSKNDELSELIKNFNLMVQQLSKNEYLHKDFVSNLSHEYKTPLTAIQGYAEMLSTCTLSEEQIQEYANNILKQSIRLSNLSKELLRLSEIENKSIKKEEYQLDVQIRDVIILLQKQWEDKQINLDIELEEVIFLGDKELMFHAVVNLIENAIKYSNIKGNIKINLFKDEKIMLIIEDDGIGIDQSKLDKIFNRFYQTDESHSSIGNGLGLSIVNQVIKSHNGLIEVESQIDNGTIFKIKL